MAEEEDDRMLDQNLPKASKLQAMVKECIISASQEEILQRTQRSPHSSHATPSMASQPNSRDCLTVGAHQTIFYSPPEETPPYPHSHSQVEEEEEEESFDPKFESDREESQSLNTQCLHFTKPFPIFNSTLQTPPQSKPYSALPLQEASSANSKLCNPALPQNNAMVKPSACRRRLIGPSQQVKTPATSPPDLQTLTDTPHPNSQVNYGQLFDSHHFNTQDFHSLGQIETTHLAAGASAAGKSAEVGEKGEGQSWGEGIRVRRTLPPFFSIAQREVCGLSCLEGDSSAPTLLEKEISASTSLDPKRQKKVAGVKPYTESLMDVIMHCSGDPPVGYQDADVLEAAINAGITFPPPLSRRRYCK